MAGITEYAYPNGLRVLLLPDAGSATMTVNMIYMVGSRHEGYGETGMAHLLEHMNFILTTDGRNIKQELTGRGATWNGTTSYDRTNYYETFKASEDNLKWALGLEADRMVKMRIEKPLLDTEMTVVRNEFERGENSVTNVLAERVLSTAFLWHNYGKSTIGSRQDIEKVPIDRLAAFYRKYYQPDNAVLVIAGPIDPSKTLTMIAQSLGVIPRPTRKLDETYTVEPIQDGERHVELRRVGKGKNIMIAYHAPALAHPDDGVIEVMEGILTGPGGTGRLYKALVDSKKALSVNMGIMELHDPGLVTVSVTLNDDQSVDEAKKIVYDTLANLVKEPPTREEVDRAKNSIVQRMDREFTNSQALAMSMTDMAAAGDWRLLFMNYEEIKRATVDDVVRVANTYFKDSNRTVGVFNPEASPDRVNVPESPSIDQLLRDYPTSINVTDGEVLDPTPSSIEKRITRLKLPEWIQTGSASEGNPRQHCYRGNQYPVWQRVAVNGEGCCCTDGRSLIDAWYQHHEPSADSGCDAEAQCADRHQRRTQQCQRLHRYDRGKSDSGHSACRSDIPGPGISGIGFRTDSDPADRRGGTRQDGTGLAGGGGHSGQPEPISAQRCSSFANHG